jgi:hypothetical protein
METFSPNAAYIYMAKTPHVDSGVFYRQIEAEVAIQATKTIYKVCSPRVQNRRRFARSTPHFILRHHVRSIQHGSHY